VGEALGTQPFFTVFTLFFSMSLEDDAEAILALIEEGVSQPTPRVGGYAEWFTVDEKGFAYYIGANKGGFVVDSDTDPKTIEEAIPVEVKGRLAVLGRVKASLERRVLEIVNPGYREYEVRVSTSDGDCVVHINFNERRFYSTCNEYTKSAMEDNPRLSLCKHVVAAFTQPAVIRDEFYRVTGTAADPWEEGRVKLGFGKAAQGYGDTVVDERLASHWIYYFLKYVVAKAGMKAMRPLQAERGR